ncbi:unnamed protein product, partial [Owenia fusiformis]
MKRNVVFCLCILQTVTRGTLVINELNADQPSTDTLEYIELYNTSPSDVVMDGYTLVLYNGALNPTASYRTIALDGHCISGLGYFVIGSPTMTNPTPNIQFLVSSNAVQNGGSTSSDGVGLYHGDVSNTANLVDFIAYSTYVAQTSVGPFYPDYLPQDVIAIEDSAYATEDVSLNRCNGNAVKDMTQFETRHLSPGTVNLCDGSVSPISVPTMASENCGTNTNPTTATSDLTTLHFMTTAVTTSAITTPDVTTQHAMTTAVTTPDVTTPTAVTTSAITTPDVTTPAGTSLNLLDVFENTKNTKMTC